MKRLIAIMAMVGVLIGCGVDTGKPTKTDKAQAGSGRSTVETIEPTLLAELAKDDSKIYSERKQEDGVYKGLTLEWKGNKKSWDWPSSSNPTYYPHLYSIDIDGDTRQELVVILTTGTGAGVHEQAVHVIREDFTEIPVENPLDFINRNVTSAVIPSNGTVKVTLEYDRLKAEEQFKQSDAGFWFDRLAYGSILTYQVVNDRLEANVSAQASPSTFVWTIRLRFSAQNQALAVDRMEWQKTE